LAFDLMQRRAAMADENRTFSTTQSQANRGRQQGLGVGQQEMDLQGDPTRDQHDNPEAANFQADNPQEDWGDPADEGAVHGENHLSRGEKTDAERGQGTRTVQANKDIVSNRAPD
jgi:hypothetical protein